jgi:CHASE3 domain sensor protein
MVKLVLPTFETDTTNIKQLEKIAEELIELQQETNERCVDTEKLIDEGIDVIQATLNLLYKFTTPDKIEARIGHHIVKMIQRGWDLR